MLDTEPFSYVRFSHSLLPSISVTSAGSPLVVGVDIGSTVVKAVTFDRRGRALSAGARSTESILPQAGWVERDAEATWQAAAAALRDAVAGLAERVAAVSVTGCGNGAIFLDRSGRPLGRGILSSDTRAAAMTPRRGYPGQTAVLLRWLEIHRPTLTKRLRHVLFWKDFIRLRLTGEFATDATDVGAAGFRSPSREAALPSRLPSLAVAGKVTNAAAHMTGLRAGTPVVVGCIDCEAAAIGSGVARNGVLSLVAGTWSINQTFVSTPPKNRTARDLFLVNPSVTPGRWLLLEGSPTSASHFDWFVKNVHRSTAFDEVAKMASASEAGDLMFFPRLFSGQGAFIGLGPHHDLGAMARAVLEGVVYFHRIHVEKLEAAGRRFHVARLAGGAARSSFWCQLFADILGVSIEVPRAEEPGALGAALVASVGVELWPSLAAAQTATIKVDRRFQPNLRAKVAYDRAYQRFLRLAARSDL